MVTEDQVREALRTVIDPELGANIVDLGLIYGVKVDDRSVHIAITMTTPACPLHEYLTAQIDGVLRPLFPDVRSVDVALVWERPWNPDMMSPALKRALGRAG
jgi:metal-sulfur cluster biosynthetic enzyme